MFSGTVAVVLDLVLSRRQDRTGEPPAPAEVVVADVAAEHLGRRAEGQASSAARYSRTTDGSRMTGPITATPAAPATSSLGTSSGPTPPSA